MSKEYSSYQKIILRDVLSPKYSEQKKWVWALFGFFALLFLTFFFAFFFEGLKTHIGFIGHMYRYSLTTTNETFKTVVYMYQHALLLFAFFAVILIFAVFALFAYDMQERNEVIRSLLKPSDNAGASEKD